MNMLKKFKYLFIILPFLFLVMGSFAYCHDYKIAIVISSDLKEYKQAYNGIVHCSDWEEARVNIHPIYFDASKSIEIIQRLTRLRPDLIFTIGTKATKTMTNIIKDIPIIFCMVFERRLLEDLKECGNSNVVGIDSYFPVETQLKVIKEILPHKSRIGVLYDSENSQSYINEALIKAKELHLNLIIKEVSSQADVLRSLDSIKMKIDVLWSIPDRTIYSPHTIKAILLFSLRNKIPLIGLSNKNVASGALYSLFCNYSDLGCQAVKLALEILKGKRLPPLYTEDPRKQFLAINLRTAEILDIKLSDEVINQAVMIYGLDDHR